jgi:lytic murein transglycosylase
MIELFRCLIVAATVAAISLALPALAAVDRPGLERAFPNWLETEIWPEAQAAGVSRKTFDAAFRGVTLDWEMPELRPPGAPAEKPRPEYQAEFRSPGAYFDQRRMNNEVAHARAELGQWKKTLAAIEQRYGVPAEIVVAIWARESSFGRASIPHSAIRTLATHAYIGRRPELFRKELIAALQILENGDISPAKMKSSWAGALGQPQFLPSHFLKYAVDFDGDGDRDIWNSVPDTLASIANFLRMVGWNPERSWGVEARVPANISCTLEGPEQTIAMEDWARSGVTQIGGKPLPVRPGELGFLMMPAGRHGPAFIVSENFYILKKYNFSDLYALYVGHLADRMANNRKFASGWGDVGGFSRADVRRMQLAMERQGYDVGGADGLVGFKTRIATGIWQAKAGQKSTCFPDAAMVRSIR